MSRGHPWPHKGQPHPLQGDDKGLVPGLPGHRPPTRLAHNTIVHLQHGQHLTCRARTRAQGRPGVGVLCFLPQLPAAPYSLASSPPPRCCLVLPRSQPGEGLPASAAPGDRPGTAVSSCSQPRRRTCSVPVGSTGGGGGGDVIRCHPPRATTSGLLEPQKGSLLQEMAESQPTHGKPLQPLLPSMRTGLPAPPKPRP